MVVIRIGPRTLIGFGMALALLVGVAAGSLRLVGKVRFTRRSRFEDGLHCYAFGSASGARVPAQRWMRPRSGASPTRARDAPPEGALA